jgi:hypothetical protein
MFERRRVRRVIDAYNAEMARRLRLGTMTSATDLEDKVDRLRQMHQGSLALTGAFPIREGAGQMTVLVDRQFEEALLEVWARELVSMSASELLAFETERDRQDARIARYERGEPTIDDRRHALNGAIEEFGSLDAYLRDLGMDPEIEESALRREAEQSLLRQAGVDSVDDLS